MAMKLKFTLFCLATASLLISFAFADNPADDDTVQQLLGSLVKFKPTINGSLEKVVETMRKNRQAARAANLALKTGQAASLQAKMDKVGKLLGIVADLVWQRLYFATDGGKIMVHSMETGDTKSVVENPKNQVTGEAEGFYGITYDPKEKKMYFSSSHAIYRANLDGSELEMVWSSIKCKRISGLAFDWNGRNLYGVSWAGILFACKERVTGRMECWVLWEKPGIQLEGIVVDPKNGTMYWTAPGKIMKSNMDGSEAQEFLKGFVKPFGILIDRQKNQLVSTDPAQNALAVTQLGGTVRTMRNETLSPPRGIAFDDKSKCVGSRSSISCGEEFWNSTLVYNGPEQEQINHLFMPGFKYANGGVNNCDEVPACPTICLLKPITPNGSSTCFNGKKL